MLWNSKDNIEFMFGTTHLDQNGTKRIYPKYPNICFKALFFCDEIVSFQNKLIHLTNMCIPNPLSCGHTEKRTDFNWPETDIPQTYCRLPMDM